jgi:hypothetical protein
VKVFETAIYKYNIFAMYSLLGDKIFTNYEKEGSKNTFTI